MSARNYFPLWDKNIDNCLPSINQQRFSYRSNQEYPSYSANRNNLLNRNINYNFEIQPYDSSGFDRTSSSFSDLLSESETGTPDIRSEESDSSAGSALCRSTAEATRALADEWECIERTIYDEDGKKVTRPQLIEECRQWKQIHPHLRIVGKAITLPEKKSCHRQVEHEEIIAIHYSDYEHFSESEERHSQSSTDVTPQNSPRGSLCDEPLLSREKITDYGNYIEDTLPDTFCSLLQITPINIRSPSHRKRKNSSILKSELSSSKWMHNNCRPDSSVNICDRNSAKSFISLDTRKYGYVLSATERNKTLNRVLTAKHHRDSTKLEPLYSPEYLQSDSSKYYRSLINKNVSIRKTSLPPLMLEEEKKKVNSARKQCGKSKKNKKHSSLSENNTRKERIPWN